MPAWSAGWQTLLPPGLDAAVLPPACRLLLHRFTSAVLLEPAGITCLPGCLPAPAFHLPACYMPAWTLLEPYWRVLRAFTSRFTLPPLPPPTICSHLISLFCLEHRFLWNSTPLFYLHHCLPLPAAPFHSYRASGYQMEVHLPHSGVPFHFYHAQIWIWSFWNGFSGGTAFSAGITDTTTFITVSAVTELLEVLQCLPPGSPARFDTTGRVLGVSTGITGRYPCHHRAGPRAMDTDVSLLYLPACLEFIPAICIVSRSPAAVHQDLEAFGCGFLTVTTDLPLGAFSFRCLEHQERGRRRSLPPAG